MTALFSRVQWLLRKQTCAKHILNLTKRTYSRKSAPVQARLFANAPIRPLKIRQASMCATVVPAKGAGFTYLFLVNAGNSAFKINRFSISNSTDNDSLELPNQFVARTYDQHFSLLSPRCNRGLRYALLSSVTRTTA